MYNLLIVDDEEFLLVGMKRIFQSAGSDFNIFTADSGNAALEILENENIDLIISDMYMPEMSGYELLNRVKNNYPNIVRILLSGYIADSVDMTNNNIAHMYLSKPLRTKALINEIKEFMANQEHILEEA